MRAPDSAPDGRDPPLQISRLTVPRTARYVRLGDPSGQPEALWYGLHGYGQLADDFARSLAPLARPGRALVVPEGLSRFYLKAGGGSVGASWMTRTEREDEIADYVRYLDLLHAHVAPPEGTSVSVLGFSQGTATACRWVVYGSIRPRRLVMWGGGLPPDLNWKQAADRLRGAEVLLVHGTSDPYMPTRTLDEEVARLARRGIEARALAFEGGHEIDAAVLERIAS